TKDAGEREQRIAAMRAVGAELDELEARLKTTEAELREALLEIPNIVNESVPHGPDESANVLGEVQGTLPEFSFTPRPHWEIGDILNGIDFDRGVKMSGSRFFVLRGPVARLHRALIQFMLN